MTPTVHIMLCAGVLIFACQWMAWTKPPVVHRIVEAAKPVVTQRMVRIVEIRPEGPPIEYLEIEKPSTPPVFR